MTTSIRRLLDQIATFEAQNKAGLTPLPGELVDFFQTAREARIDVRVFDTGMTPPPQTEQVPPAAPLAFERVEGDSIELRASVPIPVVARAVLDAMGSREGRRVVITTARPASA
jgi:hypothetical protein